MKPRTARRARELWLCSPLLIFSSSLSSTGDHLPLPEGAHLSRAPLPPNQDILGRPEHRQWSRSWSSTRTIFKEGKTRMVGQPQRPPQPSRLGARAGWQARQGARRADASAVRTEVGGAQVATNQVRALEAGGRLCANQPGEG